VSTQKHGDIEQGVEKVANGASTTFTPSTALELVKLTQLMTLSTGSPQVKIALVDGAIANHPDLLPGRHYTLHNILNTGAVSMAGRHGTSIAGILYARRDSPIPGICPSCTLISQPIFTEAGPAEDVRSASAEQTSNAIIRAIDAGSNIINLSAGVANSSSRTEALFDSALEYAARRNVLVIAASGNLGRLETSVITRHPWLIPVAPCDNQGRILTFSNLSAAVGRRGLLSPGDDIVTLNGESGYRRSRGSSVAVPFVTGTAALL
jgi:subtilisin family serine protease